MSIFLATVLSTYNIEILKMPLNMDYNRVTDCEL